MFDIDKVVIYINVKKEIRAQQSVYVILRNEFFEDSCRAALWISVFVSHMLFDGMEISSKPVLYFTFFV